MVIVYVKPKRAGPALVLVQYGKAGPMTINWEFNLLKSKFQTGIIIEVVLIIKQSFNIVSECKKILISANYQNSVSIEFWDLLKVVW